MFILYHLHHCCSPRQASRLSPRCCGSQRRHHAAVKKEITEDKRFSSSDRLGRTQITTNNGVLFFIQETRNFVIAQMLLSSTPPSRNLPGPSTWGRGCSRSRSQVHTHTVIHDRVKSSHILSDYFDGEFDIRQAL